MTHFLCGRSKPSDERAVTVETRQTLAAQTAGATTSVVNEVPPDLQGTPAAPVVAASETVAGTNKDGAATAAVDAVPVFPIKPLSPPSVVAAPPRQQASRRRKSRATRDRDADFDNRPSMESYTAQDVQKNKSNLASTTAQWSFYPMNVTFVTEVDSKEERYLYATIVVAVVVIIALVVVAVALVLSGKRQQPHTACHTQECAEAQEFLMRLLNNSKDACSDFYGYVCDSWLSRPSGSFLGDSAAASAAKTLERLLLIRIDKASSAGGTAKARSEATEGGTIGTEGTDVARGLYQRCHRYVSEKTTSAAFRESLEAARSDLNWTLIRRASSIRDLMALVARTSLLAGFHTVFALNLLNENGKLVLRLSAGKSLLCKLTLSWNRKELEEVLGRVIDDVQELAQVLNLDSNVADDLGCEHDDSDTAIDDRSVPMNALFADLVPGVNASDWIDTLNALVQNAAKKDLSNFVLASRADNVRTAFGKIYSDGVVSVAATYLASHLDADLLFLELSRERVASDVTATATFCLALARRCLAYSWPQLVARLLDLGRSTRVIQTMYRELNKRSRQASLFRWLRNASHNAAEKKIKRTALVVVPGNVQADDGAKADYAWLASHLEKSGSTHFVRLFVRMLEHEHALQLQRPPSRLQLLTSRLEQFAGLAYMAALNAVLVPTLYQSPPLLYSDLVPAYFNYGTVGALLASRIIEVIVPAPSAPVPLPGRGPPRRTVWTQAALRMYNHSTRCLQRLHRSLGLQDEVAGSDEQQRRAMFLGAQGLRIAYDSMQAVFSRATAQQDAFRALWPHARAMFFARFCLLSCDADQRPRPLSPRGNCLLPLHSMPEFNDTFYCGTHENFTFDNCML
ncbi:hypothetical protein HPB50_023369 [Hyalomma asiaticum]|uniref:Uncharacterized protein n=1 Tax=Hyalomma asiaticum TaxID=266040 RepID=A0ACB7SSB8_HYAAI|nr:hypothetical protein HPB50_023369 [Hyalomma asiaticum]